MLAVDQRKKSGVGATVTGSPAGKRHQLLFFEKRFELDQLRLRGLDQRAGFGMPLLGLLPGTFGIAAIELGSGLAKLLAGAVEFAFGNHQQPVHGQAAEPFFEAQFLLELVATQPERGAPPLDACSVSR